MPFRLISPMLQSLSLSPLRWPILTVTLFAATVLISLIGLSPKAIAQEKKEQIPHNQSAPPGPALSPEEAIAKMTVPEGFSVELVASEPDIVNPVSMTFDERGRVWITESLEYPRTSAGPGKDRVRILEDTDLDGKMDKFTVFADGLNIPSGIAVGYGGVWVANSPDILFLQDTDGDDRADTSRVVVTGFGRDDTHELPNSLTWGPDGWLYGLNGVFNRSVVRDPVSGRVHDFTCALFRINPRTNEFQLFAEGTSNPWGVAWNPVGDAFVSACVIDHLWHLSETGYYHRQGGPYPPYTWKAESIVSHKHQKAAYCGIHYFDSDAYPPEYRDRLMMGNIHGSCINVDVLEDHGATYRAAPAEDLLSANDAWFMPVVQKTGPDGCLWILDWYDRYHCYQDARRDPDGLDRLKGRLYRLRHSSSPQVTRFNLAEETSAQLIERLHSPNIFFRDLAQRILSERNDTEANRLLEALARKSDTPMKTRLHALWARIGASPLSPEFLDELMSSSEADLRAWGLRAVGNSGKATPDQSRRIQTLAEDPHPRVRLQAAIAASKLDNAPAIPILIDVLARSEDPLTPRIVWQNIHPHLESQTVQFVASVKKTRGITKANEFPAAVVELLPRAADRILGAAKPDTDAVTQLVSLMLLEPGAAESADRALQLLTQRVRSGELKADSLKNIRSTLGDSLKAKTTGPLEDPVVVSALELGASVGMMESVDRVSSEILKTGESPIRLRFLNAIINAGRENGLEIATLLLEKSTDISEQQKLVQAIGRIAAADASTLLVSKLPGLPEAVQPVAVEALTDRAASSKQLLAAVAEKKIPAAMINANQARKMLSLKDAELSRMLGEHWGTVRTDRDPARARLISQMRNTLRTSHGDAASGQKIFRRVCGQCHKMYGEGAEVGPDVTRNGRASFEQLLSNVFDPSLVIGASYQALTIVTTDGRVISGLPVEDSPQRVVLKVQGDKQEVIARTDIEEIALSRLSLMPEGLEKQLQPQEMIDLFAFLTLDRPPQDAEARLLPGSRVNAAATTDAAEFPGLVQQILPGFETRKSGVDGVALIPDYHGRPALRTHPVGRGEPCSLTATLTVPEGKRVTMRVSVAPDQQGDWQLIVRLNGKAVHQSMVQRINDQVVWNDLDFDVSEFAGQSVKVEVLNKANDWSFEFGYWNAVEFFTEE
ncbi:MAG: HEAT repeat domain-containing protein [Planctomyces sp.]|nr:HEAT repeat domain-containing protein [Planctomyces sp.]